MAQFKFPLEQVLTYRTQLETEAKVQLALVEKERKREEERLQTTKESLLFEENRLASLKPEEFDSRWLIENFIKGLRQDIIECQKHLLYWKKQCEDAQKKLAEKALDKKILEKLKEKQAEKYAYQEKQNEQKFFDEIIAGKKQRQG